MSALRADDDALTIEDHFCGAGGSTTGALMVPDVRVVHAANHSALAIQTHSHNYPDVEHSLADIPSMDPSRCPDGDVLITTPECRARSFARGRPKNDPHLFKPGDGLDEKSRATMDEVPRWAEAKRYQCVVVENVPQLIDWCEPIQSGHRNGCNCGVTFRRWMRDMYGLGYDHRKLFLNSAFFPPTPQSRDRIYVVFWKRGQRVPDLDYHPDCWCNECQALCKGVQTAKPHLEMPRTVRLSWGPHDTVWGRYGQQYFYACDRCGARAVPAITPAATAIEWDRPAVKIGDRDRPLADGTMKRIARGLERLRERPFVVPLAYLTAPESRRARDAYADVLGTVTGQHRDGLVVQVAGNLGRLMADGKVGRPVEESHFHGTERPLKVVHGSIDRAIVVPAGGPERQARGTGDPLPTTLTRESSALVGPPERAVVISKHEFGKRMSEADAQPLPTTTASGATSAYLMGLPRLAVSNMEHNVPAVDTDEPLGTVTSGNKLYAVDPWIVPLRNHANAERASTDPMPTVVASGNHHGLMTPPQRMIVANYGGPQSGESQQGWVKDADANPVGTHTATDSHAVVEYRGPGNAGRVEDPFSTLATHEQHALAKIADDIMECTFRMLEPSEIARGMVMHVTATGLNYVIHGNRRDQVRQLGNAVTPPPMAFIISAIKDSLS